MGCWGGIALFGTVALEVLLPLKLQMLIRVMTPPSQIFEIFHVS